MPQSIYRSRSNDKREPARLQTNQRRYDSQLEIGQGRSDLMPQSLPRQFRSKTTSDLQVPRHRAIGRSPVEQSRLVVELLPY